MWTDLFNLFDRDRSGVADEMDVLAALKCSGRTEDQAKRMLAQSSEDGRVTIDKFKSLIEESISHSMSNQSDEDPVARDGATAKFVLGIIKDFEKRSTARGEFMVAAEARHYARGIRETEETRIREQMAARQSQEKNGIQEAHVAEAVEFNRAWTKNMDEFEERARQIVQELHDRHQVSLNSFIEREREETMRKMKHSKAVLDLMQVQEKLARSGNYLEAQKCQRKLNSMTRQEASAMKTLVDEAVKKKVEGLRATQRLEMDALIARIERGRGEHRGHWTQGAQRLMQSHKNMITDLSTRQCLEVNRAAITVQAELVPVIKGQPSPRRRVGSAGRAHNTLPPPKQRPSKLPPVV
mmetsp:Transcript_62479/g.103959  ORF Transcript_62479/g.103959 Transcript_62479/m.103959 type:complete len:354 (+) Transcript_62479:108-1169(+)|eukprot:CAMPEP_0119340914 /NCGR_PEP_ID=MMETSP1333-20130426/101259_1 /TAXON_ID=418940 /ORGANISM="Scyphosphaera apsteinii, Strain RCC1455" /LENGTH=353 /DNA_ID=CAMNT_0007352777 /DNA_START=106 /DNA_END=1167 /DNA_ORIENTATION=+